MIWIAVSLAVAYGVLVFGFMVAEIWYEEIETGWD